MNRDLAERTALVTGASRGIGRAIAIELARRGANVAINFRRSEAEAVAVAQQVDSLGGGVMVVKADVSIAEEAQRLVAVAHENFGQLDCVISNAAAGGFRGLADLKSINFEATLRANAAPVVWLAQAAVPLMTADQNDSPNTNTDRLHGKIVAVSSHGSRWAVPHYGAIGASKAALESLVRHLALEFGDQGINFNCVLPGIIATEAIASMPGVEDLIDAASQRMMVGNRRLCEQDVASVVGFLCSSDSDMIQGQTLVVDGGVSIRV